MGIPPPAPSWIRSAARRLGIGLLVAAGALPAFSQTPTAPRVLFPGSIRPVPAAAGTAPRHARMLRPALSPVEAAAPMTFEVALRMRNFPDLQARLARGELISRAEMEATYDPLPADLARVEAWVRGQGLEVTRTAGNRLAVFGRGSVAAVAQAFQTSFARVAADDGEFTSAVTAPSLPADLAGVVLGVHGLQPHLHFERRLRPAKARPEASADASSGYYPAQIAAAYNATGTGLTGLGQTIAILSGAFAASSDVTNFWSAAGVANSYSSHIQNIMVGSGPAAGDTTSGLEAALDVEWASSLAPGAVIRVYGANFNDPNFFDEILLQIYEDLAAVPSIHQVSISYGGDEAGTDRDYTIILSQYCANLASAGVAIFCASGDTGAVQSGVLTVSVPTSDPNVTGVGGTTLALSGTGTVTSETGWSESGGGISAVFAIPGWQAGTGVPAGSTLRLVPDVAAAANAASGAAVYYGSATTVTGTSWATPIWAAFCALINQSRVTAGQAPLGNLNARLYPQLGTTSFRDITSGNNGTYNCTAGYDLVTGLGVPNVGALVQASLAASAAPAVYSQLGNQIVTPGQTANFFAVGTGAPPLSYQWQRKPAGGSTFVNLSDNGTYSGSATSLLMVSGASYAMNGDQFQCVVADTLGSAASNPPDSLTVNAYGVTTLAGWPFFWGTSDGTGWLARFEFPGSIREDTAGNLYVSDGNANTIRKVTQAGVVTTVAGAAGIVGSTDGPVAAARFNAPSGVVYDPTTGNLYVADDGNYTIRKISGGMVSTLAGAAGSAASVNGVGTQARFTDPQDVAVDAAGNLYVADGAGNQIRKVTPGGAVTTLAGNGVSGNVNGPGTAAEFKDPVGVAVDGAGNVYVADLGNNEIREVTPAGTVSTFAGSARSGSADGPAVSAQFSGPSGVSVDSAGNVYVADTGNDTIRMITPGGTVSTVAGSASATPDNIDGPDPAAVFFDPAQVFPDPATGVLFVADSGNGTIRRIVPGALVAPQITANPASQSISSGQSAVFAAAASGSPALFYQWQQLLSGAAGWSNLSDGGAYSGSASATLTITGATVALYGSQYRCVVQNSTGSATSGAATLTVLGPPAIQTMAQTQAVVPGGATTLTVAALGPGTLTYQWLFNGNPIAGATAAATTVSNFTAANAGTYSVTVTNSYGSTTAPVATLSLASARLVNLSASAQSTAGSGVLSAGFIVGGTGSKQVLLRGIGPTLGTAFGLSGVLPDPSLTWFNASSVALGSNTIWGGTSALIAAFAQSFAFALPVNSADSALIETASPGAYSIQVAGAKGDSGFALAEIYDLDAITAPARLINLSSRSTVTGSSGVLTAGFIIGGSGTETVLIRGVGPTLANYGVASGYLSNPVITLFQGSTVLASNAGWGNSAALSSTFSQVNAFPLNPGSNDAAMVISLPAGNYTVQVTGANGSAGVALVEIYEVAN